MNKEEIQKYLKRVDELELRLDEEDKDTLQWLIFGYNECAKLLYEKEQEIDRLNNDIKTLLKENEAKEKVIKKQDYVINELEKWLEEKINESNLKGCSFEQTYITGKWNAYKKSLNKLKELKEEK